jgi:hypothetical protein
MKVIHNPDIDRPDNVQYIKATSRKYGTHVFVEYAENWAEELIDWLIDHDIQIDPISQDEFIGYLNDHALFEKAHAIPGVAYITNIYILEERTRGEIVFPMLTQGMAGIVDLGDCMYLIYGR